MRRLIAISVLLAALTSSLVLATGSHAGSGGTAVGGTTLSGSQNGASAQFLRGVPFGARILAEGMRGDDVRALHGIVKSVPYGHRIGLHGVYHRRTSNIVRRFQRDNSLPASGVVTRRTARALVRSMDVAQATWYGPGLYGNTMACGRPLRVGTVGVAHRTLPCGTRVTFRHKGRTLVTRVTDRGPFVSGIDWDLTNGAKLRLGFDGKGPIRYVVAD